jgi:hypothetical protein
MINNVSSGVYSVTPKKTITLNRNEYDINDAGMTFERGTQYECQYVGDRRYCVYLGKGCIYLSADDFLAMFQ